MSILKFMRNSFLGTAAVLALAVGASAACIVDADGGSGFDWPWSNDAYRYTEDFHKVIPLPADGSFSLRNTNGKLQISTWDRPEVEIKAVKSARNSESDLDLVRIEIETGLKSVAVDTVYERRLNLRVNVNYEVRVPEGVRLDNVQLTNGDIVLTGRFSDVEASTTNGGIRLENASGRISLGTTNGGIKAHDVRGPLQARTTNGSITLECREIADDVNASTTNGSITLRVPRPPDADVSLRTTNGSIKLDHPLTIQGTVSSKRRMQGQMGKGGPEISLKTTNGSITFAR
jgi:DUF4097 and DUF4098 domain-containing protein YvlB